MAESENLIFLTQSTDSGKINVLKHLIRNNYEVFYIHESHLQCPTLQDYISRNRHWYFIVFCSAYFEQLVSIIIGLNAEIPPQELDDDIKLDTSAINIGFCPCGINSYPGMEF